MNVLLGSKLIVTLFGILVILLSWSLSKELGSTRATVIGFLRVIWLVPVLSTLFPQKMLRQIVPSTPLKYLNVFIDDSLSMRESGSQISHLVRAKQFIKKLERYITKYGYHLDVTELSSLNQKTSKGYSPLNESLARWFSKITEGPYIVFTDANDMHPQKPWDKSYKAISRENHGDTVRGTVVGFPSNKAENYWVNFVNFPLLSFEDHKDTIWVKISRNRLAIKERHSKSPVQLQLRVDGTLVKSENFYFDPGKVEALVPFDLPLLKKGAHTVAVYLVPKGDETVHWDNQMSKVIKVLPNTHGVLHLLGSPSWDGRFLRRYLKGEPKFDVISFFILRDPWDRPSTSKKELSLIPFPVHSLFTEHLHKFKVIVMQNFSTFRFLKPLYQKKIGFFHQEWWRPSVYRRGSLPSKRRLDQLSTDRNFTL